MKKEKLHKVAPKLSRIPRESGFIVPKKYFKQVERTLLFEMKSTNVNTPNSEFKTPEDYFDEVEDIVIAKLKAVALQNKYESSPLVEDYFDKVEDAVMNQLKSAPKVAPLRRRILKYMMPVAAAASLLLLILLNTEKDPIVTFDSLATSEIESLIEEGMINIDAESLAMVFPDVEIENDVFDLVLSNEEVLDYLNDTELENITFDN